jgi:hypothetical protein
MGSNTKNCEKCGMPNWAESEACQYCSNPLYEIVPPITKEELLKKKVIKEV